MPKSGESPEQAWGKPSRRPANERKSFGKSPLCRSVAVRTCSVLLAISLVLLTPSAGLSYSVMAHKAMVDVVWESHLKPLLRQKFPLATEDELNAAEAYAYGGSILQDLGYYPYGSPFFSDLTHYVRTGDFVKSLIRNSHDVYDYAFALGAMAHYSTDIQGHRIAVNRAAPILYPKLEKKFGDTATYEDDPLAHIKTEFGFDVLEVARGRYAPEQFHDFIGFEVAQELLDQAFRETYGLELRSVLENEDKALNSYRRDVSKLIPRATRIAWTLKRKEIQLETPSATQKKFLYNLSRADFEKEWGTNYVRPGFGDRFLAFVWKLIPKFGPLKILKLRLPTPETEKLFEASFNSSLNRYRELLNEERQGHLQIPNLNLDTGMETFPGQYRLSDTTHARLLDKLAQQGFKTASPELRAEILNFYSHPEAAYSTKKDPKEWSRVQAELEELRQTAAPAANGKTRDKD